MGYSNAYTAYQKTNINTASQGRLVVLLYEGIIKQLTAAINYIEKNGKIAPGNIEKYGICIARGTDTLEAALPNEEVQKMLQISSGSPIFIRTRKTYLKNDEIFEYSFCYYPGNRYKYSVEL